MLSQRSATTVAIVAGATFGALVAWLRAGPDERASMHRVPASVSAPSPSTERTARRSPVAAAWLPKSGPIAAGWKKGDAASETKEPLRKPDASTEKTKASAPKAARTTSPVERVSSAAKPRAPRPRQQVRAEAKPELPPELMSPHDRPVATERQLRVAEVRCDRRDPNECLRAADAYEKGEVVDRNEERVERNKKIAHTLYMRQCDGGQAASCYQLARMYEHGEFIKKNPEIAAALRTRAGELCERKKNPVCDRIRELTQKR
jgi:hypothetical protein